MLRSPDSGLLASIIEIITHAAVIQELAPDQDFYQAGVTSLMALPLLLEMEDRFGVTIPDDQFIQARTACQMEQVINALREGVK